MKYASTFLSHSSVDKPLVEAVAAELGRLGIIPWLDINELEDGRSLTEQLKNAIKNQITVTLFLSESAMQSAWVKQELLTALELENEPDRKDHIIPIFLGDPMALVTSNQLLREKWMHPDGDRADRKGIIPKKNLKRTEISKDIAKQIAGQIYKILNIKKQNEIIIYLDQRGAGKRSGLPVDVPTNIQSLDVPILVFRPDMKERTHSDIRSGDEWNEFKNDIGWAISEGFGVLRGPGKKIRILGNAQLALPFLIGKIFDRSTSTNLYCTLTKDGVVFNNSHQPRNSPLEGGDASCAVIEPDEKAMRSIAKNGKVSLLLSKKYLLEDVQSFLTAQPDLPPLFHILSGDFVSNEQVMKFIADVVAVLLHLKREYNVRTIYLFCGLPFHVLPLLAANLLHVVDEVIFMEFNREAKIEHKYLPLEMKI